MKCALLILSAAVGTYANDMTVTCVYDKAKDTSDGGDSTTTTTLRGTRHCTDAQHKFDSATNSISCSTVDPKVGYNDCTSAKMVGAMESTVGEGAVTTSSTAAKVIVGKGTYGMTCTCVLGAGTPTAVVSKCTSAGSTCEWKLEEKPTLGSCDTTSKTGCYKKGTPHTEPTAKPAPAPAKVTTPTAAKVTTPTAAKVTTPTAKAAAVSGASTVAAGLVSTVTALLLSAKVAV